MSQDSVAKILRLLKNNDVEIQCAAAMVLSRLRPLEDRVIKALRLGMRQAPTHAKSYFLDALLQTKNAEVLPDIVCLLDEKGSIADQAVGVVRQFGGAALEEIERCHQGQDGWRNGAYIKAVAGIHQVRAVHMLMGRLPYTTWEEARGTSLFVAEHFDRYPKGAKKFLESAIRKMIAEPPEGLPPYCLITCLKLVRRLKIEAAPEALLHHAESSDVPSLRRHALAALEVQTPEPSTIEDSRERLYRLLSHDNRDVTEPAGDVLVAWAKPAVPAKELRALATRNNANLKDYVFGELARRKDKQATAILKDHLSHPLRRVRHSAARTLVKIKNGDRVLFDEFMQSEDTNHRREFVEVLVQSSFEPEEKEIKSLRRRLAEGFLDQRIDHAILQFLGMRDRQGLNATLVRRAKKLIKDGQPNVAIHSLQPLVRFRHATHDTRLLLAIANFKTAENTRDNKDGRYKRCIDILSPLSRVHDLNLDQKIRRSKNLNSADRVAILRGLCQRGGMEKRICRLIVEQVHQEDLDETDASTLNQIKVILGV